MPRQWGQKKAHQRKLAQHVMAGQVHLRQGFFTVQQPCPTCHGRGKVIKEPCSKCHGDGRVERYKTLSVKIPAGSGYSDRPV